MKVINLSNNLVLSTDLKIATTFSDKLLGFLKTSNLGGLMFKTRLGIHTYFLKTAIDVVILDKNFKIVKMRKVHPNRLFFWNPQYNLVLELPSNSIKQSKTSIGDNIILKN